ncbi:MAG: alpha-amylase family glycosyl hydrolase [Phototrophicaceae bacterium]|jgi:glycosidase
MIRKLVFVVLMMLLSVPILAQEADNLHVESPMWEDQIIYFLMIDRFNDGDPTNNDQGMGEYDPTDERRFQGGDLQGVIDQIDYIKGLGATAVWITPPVANQWWDPLVDFGGYHGYWAENFMAVDAHFGTLETYQALSSALHNNEMYLIQDIVANHTGNFYSYPNRYVEGDPTAGLVMNTETVPVTAPSQAPFDMNDPRNPDHLAANIYHFEPTIGNFNDLSQRLTRQLADLDDLNTENPVVREALKESYNYWIENVGVDGYRIDTVIYVEHDFWNDFTQAPNGINATARATGRDDFFTYGEAFIGSEPYADNGEQEIVQYIGTAERPELSSVLNFPLHFSILRVFAQGAPTAELTARLDITQATFANPNRLPVFIDNHDVERFVKQSSVDGLKQALLFMFTAPGIPVVYQGTEQALDEQRMSLFAEGWGSGGVDHFDTESAMYGYIASIAALRTDNAVFRRGDVTTLYGNANGVGAMAFRRDYAGQSALMVFNTAERPALMANVQTGYAAGVVLETQLALQAPQRVVVGVDGFITLELPPREGLVLRPSAERVADAGSSATLTVTAPAEDATFSDDIVVSGTSAPDAEIKLALNGTLTARNIATADADGNWSLTLPIASFPLGVTQHNIMAFDPLAGAVSVPVGFSTDVTLRGEPLIVSDVPDDDVGPYGIYTMPRDPTFNNQLDILEARYTVSGANLLVETTMAEVTTVWGPINNFDHVLFHIFIDVPGVESGVSALPNANAEFIPGFTWDYLAFVEGWTNRYYSARDASADSYGTAITPSPSLEVDGNTIRFLFSAESLGYPETLEGVRVYIATWDWSGPEASYRDLREAGGQYAFGGANESDGYPLVLDDIALGWEPEGGSAIVLDPAILAAVNVAEVNITFVVNVPEGTPADATLFLAGPVSAMQPANSAYQLARNEDGTYQITIPAREGSEVAYRLTRGSWANQEVIDPNDRFANRTFTVGSGDETVNVDVAGWFDQR